MMWQVSCCACIQRSHSILSRQSRRQFRRLAALQLPTKTLYDVLEIPRDSSAQEIRAAFVDLSKKHHPDKSPDSTGHERFVQINRAYSILIRPDQRRDYDTSLQYRLQQQKLARAMAGMHSYHNSPMPENWTEDGTSDQRPFHDEYIFDMRDRSKDAYYQQQAYYGVPGLKQRLSNAVIVAACLGLLVFGAVVHVVVIGASSRRTTQMLDEKDKRLHASYMASKELARLHGNDLQLTLLSDSTAGKLQDDP